MNLHEFQAKDLFSQYGLPVPQYMVVDSKAALLKAMQSLGGSHWVLKAQVHAGGRGKAGGVKIVASDKEAAAFADAMFGQRLVTKQTDAQGQLINKLLVEQPCDIERELYLGAVIDRGSKRIVVMASIEGGMDIEKVAAETPDKILKITIDPTVGVMPYQCRQLAFGLKLVAEQIKPFVGLVTNMVRMFEERDLSLVEVNPLVVTKAGDILCLDAKINIDDNALFRQKPLAELRDTTQEDARELEAREWGLSYIALDGDIGCMVNGAGLAMATMDLIKLHGGAPANFLDVGGGTTKDRVAHAFKIILSDDNVKAVLINIFGGIVRCDIIAEGIVGAVAEVGINIPIVVRLEGNNADRGLEILNESSLKINTAKGLTEAAEKVVGLAG